MLQDMVEKRRREEEELQLMAQQAQEKRKKFRDVCLLIFVFDHRGIYFKLIYRHYLRKQ